MERRRVELVVTYIEISDDKAAYIQAEKHVTPADVMEVMAHRPRFFVRGSGDDEEFAALGPNWEGRYLTDCNCPTGGSGELAVDHRVRVRESRGRRLYEGGV